MAVAAESVFAGEGNTPRKEPKSCGPDGCKAGTPHLARAWAEGVLLAPGERDRLVGSLSKKKFSETEEVRGWSPRLPRCKSGVAVLRDNH